MAAQACRIAMFALAVLPSLAFSPIGLHSYVPAFPRTISKLVTTSRDMDLLLAGSEKQSAFRNAFTTCANSGSVSLQGDNDSSWRASLLQKLGIVSKFFKMLIALFKSTWWVLFAPFGIGAYLASIHYLAPVFKACPQCFDPLNILLFSVSIPNLPPLPVCVWNLSHLAMYYIYVRCIPFKRTLSRHMFAFGTGVFWFWASMAAHACNTMGLVATVYDSTWRPRPDDIVFNTGGQLIFEAHRRLRKSRGRNHI